jgi:hypothetical protein
MGGRVRRPAAFRTRSAFSVIVWFGPDRLQSATSGVVVLPGGFHQRLPGCRPVDILLAARLDGRLAGPFDK